MIARCVTSTQFASFAGALPVSQLKRGHVKSWVESHGTWALATRRNVIAIVLAAFNHAQAMHDVPNPLRGLKKPPPQPRLHSLSDADEGAILSATDECFRNFLVRGDPHGLAAVLRVGQVDGRPRRRDATGDDVAGLFVENQEDP